MPSRYVDYNIEQRDEMARRGVGTRDEPSWDATLFKEASSHQTVQDPENLLKRTTRPSQHEAIEWPNWRFTNHSPIRGRDIDWMKRP